MPLFHFHIDAGDGGESHRDLDGHELADEGAARSEAIRIARDIMADGALVGRIDLRRRLSVEAPGGRCVLRLDFAEAVEFVRA